LKGFRVRPKGGRPMPEVVTYYWLNQNFRNENYAPHPSKGLITGNWCNELDIFYLERRGLGESATTLYLW
jgi:hypothetical protein